MTRIKKESSITSMAAGMLPAAVVKSGETVVFETMDAFGGQIKTADNVFSQIGWDQVNPAAGPLFVEGAEPGDCLKVEILEITPGDKAVMILAPGFGVMDMPREVSYIFDIKDGQFIFDDKIKLKVNPMIGVIGTAPAGEPVPTGTPGPHGGNMDTNRITTGSVVYLPVNVPGALLSLGDLHAVMGDGEVCVCGAEISGEAVVKVTVLKSFNAPLPLLIAGGEVITVSSAPLLDDAAKTAVKNMHEFLVHLGLDKEKAAMLLSLSGNLRISQVVDPLMTARMEFPLWILEEYGIRL
ncbi:MAG: acetamidase/formamidase family protein [Defluviitaleaceae bacterium]|nr:acetamidase/formamidase family protein [Defluviitaleaceae bacterium]MCL2837170.1 acetamidase/formamidase family protein [Defluviitaleaceae bacterium]